MDLLRNSSMKTRVAFVSLLLSAPALLSQRQPGTILDRSGQLDRADQRGRHQCANELHRSGREQFSQPLLSNTLEMRSADYQHCGMQPKSPVEIALCLGRLAGLKQGSETQDCLATGQV